jgi:UDPglucose 6-dehydrogenase
MKIGIIGVGTVGGALQYGFNRIGHEVRVYDTNRPLTRIEDVADTEVTFICVPTPSRADGSCDVSRVEDTVARLAEFYCGLAVIKSTVVPGTTARLIASYYPKLWLAVCPEFLREKASYSDFVENHEVCIVGANLEWAFAVVKAAHGTLPKSFVQLTPTEAELAKYFCNALNAARIVFASQFFEVCEALGADYYAIKNAVSKRASVGGHYLDCNKNFRGFGGACLPKDLAALAALVGEKKIDAKLFEWLRRENLRIREAGLMRDVKAS